DSGMLYLAATDTNPDVLRSTAVAARDMNELMAESRARSQLVVLDCCFSGAFAKGRPPKGAPSPGITDSFPPASGRVVLTASNHFQYSFETLDPTVDRQRSVY